ncbi:globin [Boseongicola sp. H5]|uniref:globin n=1 Tax=Boseongicola sp. H5 TaxID=2763261 RepID=UPI001D0B6090|nr:globin [Boseongicola sp. H5]
MYLEQNDMNVLKESLRRFQMRSDMMAARFHDTLLRDAPETLAFFSRDVPGHPEKALQSLYAIVALLEGTEESQRMICRLRQRQARSGLGPEVYARIYPTLEKSLLQVFGESLPPEYCRAWRAALAAVGRILYDHPDPQDG